MGDFFSGCFSSLEKINLINFICEKVEYNTFMLASCGKLVDIEYGLSKIKNPKLINSIFKI